MHRRFVWNLPTLSHNLTFTIFFLCNFSSTPNLTISNRMPHVSNLKSVLKCTVPSCTANRTAPNRTANRTESTRTSSRIEPQSAPILTAIRTESHRKTVCAVSGHKPLPNRTATHKAPSRIPPETVPKSHLVHPSLHVLDSIQPATRTRQAQFELDEALPDGTGLVRWHRAFLEDALEQHAKILLVVALFYTQIRQQVYDRTCRLIGTSYNYKLEKHEYIVYTSYAVCVCVCMCFLPIHSGHQVRWTYQPGSHRRKATQDFSFTFLRCVP